MSFTMIICMYIDHELDLLCMYRLDDKADEKTSFVMKNDQLLPLDDDGVWCSSIIFVNFFIIIYYYSIVFGG